MVYTLTSGTDGYFFLNDGKVEHDCQRGNYEAIYDGNYVTVYHLKRNTSSPVINKTLVTDIKNGDNGGATFASLIAFKAWWRAKTGLTAGSGGSGGSSGTASTYPKYTSLLLTSAVISNDNFYPSGIVNCDSVIIHNYSGGIIEMKQSAASNVILKLQPDRSYHFSGANKTDMRFKSAVANYALEIECITQ